MIIKSAIILEAEAGEHIWDLVERIPSLFSVYNHDRVANDAYLIHNGRVVKVSHGDTPTIIGERWSKYDRINTPEGGSE